MKILTQKMRTTGICLITAAAITLPTVANAGWFNKSKPAQKIAAKAKATSGNITAKVSDISQKINEMANQMKESRPLMNKVKSSNMMQTLKEVVEFMGEQQQEYQAFANGGVYAFRRNFQDTLQGFGGVVNDFPGIENADRLNQKLDKAVELINKLPSQFLFIMDKAVGEKLISVNEKISDLRKDLSKLPRLPTPRVLMQNIYAYEVELCKLVDSREVAVTVAVIQAKLKTIMWTLNTITSYLPNDLTVSATAVAGGGFTAAIHPAKVPFQIPLTIVQAVDLGIGNNVSIANAMCKGVVPTK
jgi:hypothetical protein